ncbi:hypothetical protein [Evansella clarkii]|uniref:hypothetical protein n=1 Tax=Evansella clarkii TaxID=79879 RepID=UPI0009983858|nr:hypothetical protein [Evansella clarkii]
MKVGKKVVVLKNGALLTAVIEEKHICRSIIEYKVKYLDNNEVDYVSAAQIVTKKVSDDTIKTLENI